MKKNRIVKTLSYITIGLLLICSTASTSLKECKCKDIPLYGKVKIVEHFGDFKVQVVNHFPDLKVQLVEHFPDKCGQWQLVEHFPDFTVTFVDHFPDFKIKYVDHFPGL